MRYLVPVIALCVLASACSANAVQKFRQTKYVYNSVGKNAKNYCSQPVHERSFCLKVGKAHNESAPHVLAASAIVEAGAVEGKENKQAIKDALAVMDRFILELATDAAARGIE